MQEQEIFIHRSGTFKGLLPGGSKNLHMGVTIQKETRERIQAGHTRPTMRKANSEETAAQMNHLKWWRPYTSQLPDMRRIA